MDSGLYGMQKGMSQMQQSANRIAGQEKTSGDSAQLVEDVVSLNQSKLQVQASAKVVQSANETLGTLLDVNA
jgi:hypothetical protein